MRRLPRRLGEGAERRRNALVKRLAHRLHPVVRRRTDCRALQAFEGGEKKQNGEIGNQAVRRELVGVANVVFVKAVPRDLIRVRGQKEPVQEHDVAARDGGPDLALHKLRARRHEEQCLSARIDVRSAIEQDAAHLRAQQGATGLAKTHVCDAPLRQHDGKATKLRGLAGTLAALKDNHTALLRAGHHAVTPA